MSDARSFGAVGDGKTDDTAALSHALQQGDGQFILPRGDYLITQPLHVPLDLFGRLTIDGSGGTAKILMAGPGPAIHLAGTHARSALPDHFVDKVWQKERMPILSDLEIEGRHPEADGVLVEGVMQPTFQRLLIRHCRHGIHLHQRDRNVLIADCHIYDNSGIGIYFENVNLHQTNIHGNHISYCKQGGIKIAGSEIRNIQICSNDIEYNYDLKAATSADVLFDCRNGTIREGTIVGNTIQAVLSPGGANVRLLGAGKDNPSAVGMLTISGNLLGSQQTVVHLQACRGVVLSGNCIYSGYHYALVAEDSEHLVLGSNSIDHNPDYKGKSTDCLVLRRCRHVNVNGLIVQHTRDAEIDVQASIELQDCNDISISNCQIVNARTRGLAVKRCSLVRISDSTILGKRNDASYRAAVAVDEKSTRVLVTNNFLGRGVDGDLLLPQTAGSASGNQRIDPA